MKYFPTSKYLWTLFILSTKLNISTNTCITMGSLVWTFFEMVLNDRLGKDISFWFQSQFTGWEVLPFNRELLLFGNKAKGRISKRVLQENKARQIFQKMKISYPLMFVFRKICRGLFSCNTRFENLFFALLPTFCSFHTSCLLIFFIKYTSLAGCSLDFLFVWNLHCFVF